MRMGGRGGDEACVRGLLISSSALQSFSVCWAGKDCGRRWEWRREQFWASVYYMYVCMYVCMYVFWRGWLMYERGVRRSGMQHEKAGEASAMTDEFRRWDMLLFRGCKTAGMMAANCRYRKEKSVRDRRSEMLRRTGRRLRSSIYVCRCMRVNLFAKEERGDEMR